MNLAKVTSDPGAGPSIFVAVLGIWPLVSGYLLTFNPRGLGERLAQALPLSQRDDTRLFGCLLIVMGAVAETMAVVTFVSEPYGLPPTP